MDKPPMLLAAYREKRRFGRTPEAEPPMTGGRRAPLPRSIEPQLATLVPRPPRGGGWVHEVKLDGYRLLVRLDGGQPRMYTRNDKDWTARFPALAEVLGAIEARQAWLDGEAVMLDARGVSSFEALQAAIAARETARAGDVAFDLLYLDGSDLRDLPLVERKSRLRRLIRPAGRLLHYSEHAEGNGDAALRSACDRGLEGVVSKLRNAPYVSGRSQSWLKIKCGARQEFVIVGFADSDKRADLAALLLGVHDERGRLVYAGRVGTGFTEATRTSLRARLEKLERRRPPVDEPPSDAQARRVRWVHPELVAEVAFTSWTRDGLLRHPSFHGLREDKRAGVVVREKSPASSRTSRR